MRRILLSVLLVALSIAITRAHHSYGATYDVNKEVKLTGKVAQFSLRNPHSYVQLQVPDAKGGPAQRWAIEWSGTTQLTSQGLNQESLRVGDDVVIVGRPSRVTGEFRALMVTLTRPRDGFTWGTRAGEKVD